MIKDPAYWDGLLHDVEAILEDLEPTWRERWADMAPIERTHFLNVDLLDVDRYLAKLQDARTQEVLNDEQRRRLAHALAARKRAKTTIARMVAQVEADPDAQLRSSRA